MVDILADPAVAERCWVEAPVRAGWRVERGVEGGGRANRPAIKLEALA